MTDKDIEAIYYAFFGPSQNMRILNLCYEQCSDPQNMDEENSYTVICGYDQMSFTLRYYRYADYYSPIEILMCNKALALILRYALIPSSTILYRTQFKDDVWMYMREFTIETLRHVTNSITKSSLSPYNSHATHEALTVIYSAIIYSLKEIVTNNRNQIIYIADNTQKTLHRETLKSAELDDEEKDYIRAQIEALEKEAMGFFGAKMYTDVYSQCVNFKVEEVSQIATTNQTDALEIAGPVHINDKSAIPTTILDAEASNLDMYDAKKAPDLCLF